MDSTAWVLRYNYISAQLRGAYATGGNDIAGLAVVAPEPGTMAAIGVGLVALLRRRRISS